MMAAGRKSTADSPVSEVTIDAVAVLKIVKHCHDSLPTMVAGSLLGLDTNNRLEITYSYPFPQPKTDSEKDGYEDQLDGVEYQMEMMKMLRDVNVDNNCVGWYTSMYLGTICTNDIVQYQYNYQSSEELSENSVVIMYDPIVSTKGVLVLKAFRLSKIFLELKRSKSNQFIRPSEILEELPLKIRNVGHVSAFLRCIQDTPEHKAQLGCIYDTLSSASSDAHTEKYLELLGNLLDDLVNEQQRFQQYSKAISKTRQEHLRWLMKQLQEARDNDDYAGPPIMRPLESGQKVLPEAPPRIDPLLLIGQLNRYCGQINEHVDGSMQRLLLSSQVDSSATPAAN